MDETPIHRLMAGPGTRFALLASAYAVTYVLLGAIGLATLEGSSGLTPIWLSTGLAVAVFILTPRRRWPALAAITFAASLAAQATACPVGWELVALALCSALTPALAAATMAWIAGEDAVEPVRSVRGVAALAVVAVVVTAAVALIAGAVVAGTDDAWTFWPATGTWWAADGLGIVLLTPVVLALVTRPEEPLSPVRTTALTALAFAITLLVFWHPLEGGSQLRDYAFPVLPFLLVCGLWLGARGASVALLLCGAVMIAATARGLGPFVQDGLSEEQQIYLMQAFIAISAICTLGAGAIVATSRRARASADEERQRFEGVLRAATEVSVIATDVKGVITVFNEGAERMLGHRAEDVIGRTTPMLLHEAAEVTARAEAMGIRPGFEVFVRDSRDHGAQTRDWTYIRKDGTRLTVSLTVTAIRDDDDAITGYVGIAQDITDRKRREADLRHMADHDPLTGLANRRRFGEALEAHVALAERYGPEGAVVILDVDRFKTINDTHGHRVGDQVIVAVADVLRARLRDTDVLARLGGDEFAILLPKATRAHAEIVAQTLVEAVRVEEVALPDGGARRSTISLGVAMVATCEPLTAEALVQQADRAMYAAKRGGRDGFTFWDDDADAVPQMTA